MHKRRMLYTQTHTSKRTSLPYAPLEVRRNKKDRGQILHVCINTHESVILTEMIDTFIKGDTITKCLKVIAIKFYQSAILRFEP